MATWSATAGLQGCDGEAAGDFRMGSAGVSAARLADRTWGASLLGRGIDGAERAAGGRLEGATVVDKLLSGVCGSLFLWSAFFRPRGGGRGESALSDASDCGLSAGVGSVTPLVKPGSG